MAPTIGRAIERRQNGKRHVQLAADPARRAHEALRSIVSGAGLLSPQVIPEDQHDAEEQRRRVRADRPGLQAPQQLARAADRVARRR